MTKRLHSKISNTVIDLLQTNQNNKCFYCDTSIKNHFTVDHYFPKSKGGSNDIENIVLACVGCNAKKGDTIPETPLAELRANFKNSSGSKLLSIELYKNDFSPSAIEASGLLEKINALKGRISYLRAKDGKVFSDDLSHMNQYTEYVIEDHKELLKELESQLDKESKISTKRKKKISIDIIKALRRQQKGLCFYCKTDIWYTYSVDHYIPLSNGGTIMIVVI